jgi:hypothetical protein
MSYEGSGIEEEPEGSRFGWRAAAVAILFVIVLAIAGLTLSNQGTGPSYTPVPSGPAYPVNVTSIYVHSSDNVGDWDGTTEPGFTGVANQVNGETWHITALSGGGTITSVWAITPGVTILTLSLPLTIGPGGTGLLELSYFFDWNSYDGALNVGIS